MIATALAIKQMLLPGADDSKESVFVRLTGSAVRSGVRRASQRVARSRFASRSATAASVGALTRHRARDPWT